MRSSTTRRTSSVVGREIEHRDLRLRHHVGECLVHHGAQQLGDLVRLELGIGAHQLRQQGPGVEGAQRVRAERAHADRSEVRVAHQHRIGRTPLQVRELPRADEIDLGLERAVEAVQPARHGAQDGQVARLQAVLPGAEDVCDPPLVNEDGRLAGPDDELRPVLDLVVVAGKAPDERVATVVHPLDDVDELGPQLLHESHADLPIDGVVSLSGFARSQRRTVRAV
jgi:hypothetical protein